MKYEEILNEIKPYVDKAKEYKEKVKKQETLLKKAEEKVDRYIILGDAEKQSEAYENKEIIKQKKQQLEYRVKAQLINAKTQVLQKRKEEIKSEYEDIKMQRKEVEKAFEIYNKTIRDRQKEGKENSEAMKEASIASSESRRKLVKQEEALEDELLDIAKLEELLDLSKLEELTEEIEKIQPELETETPGTETPVTETPVTETPVTETPVTETPVTETPVTETPVTETPVTETPVTETPVTETPVTETPVTETPVTETPVTETPVTETPEISRGPRGDFRFNNGEEIDFDNKYVKDNRMLPVEYYQAKNSGNIELANLIIKNRYERNEDGSVAIDENGTPVYKDDAVLVAVDEYLEKRGIDREKVKEILPHEEDYNFMEIIDKVDEYLKQSQVKEDVDVGKLMDNISKNQHDKLKEMGTMTKIVQYLQTSGIERDYTNAVKMAEKILEDKQVEPEKEENGKTSDDNKAKKQEYKDEGDKIFNEVKDDTLNAVLNQNRNRFMSGNGEVELPKMQWQRKQEPEEEKNEKEEEREGFFAKRRRRKEEKAQEKALAKTKKPGIFKRISNWFKSKMNDEVEFEQEEYEDINKYSNNQNKASDTLDFERTTVKNEKTEMSLKEAMEEYEKIQQGTEESLNRDDTELSKEIDEILNEVKSSKSEAAQDFAKKVDVPEAVKKNIEKTGQNFEENTTYKEGVDFVK